MIILAKNLFTIHYKIKFQSNIGLIYGGGHFYYYVKKKEVENHLL
jgi:hypothetical protein